MILSLLITASLNSAGLHLGMTGAVKTKVKELNDKVTENNAEKLTVARKLHVKGFGLSPRGFPVDYSLLAGFLSEVGQMKRGGVFWNGAWRDSAASSGRIPAAAELLLQNAATYGYTTILCFGWRSGSTLLLDVPGNNINNWTNTEAKALFQQMLIECAGNYHPPYIFIGNENSHYYEQDAADYTRWIQFYNSVYDEIKKVSPQTKVGIIFNMEHLSGRGTLVGWGTVTYWAALSAHNLAKVDIIGITMYPWFHYQHAAEVPADYLQELFDRTGDQAISITETGWPAEDLGSGGTWASSAQEQDTFVPKIFSLVSGKDCPIVNWLFLNFMVDDGSHSTNWKMFGSVSLRDSANTERPALATWLAQE
jgi:hypothetical protein